MNKEEYIAEHGEEAYRALLEKNREWYRHNREKRKLSNQKWQVAHPENMQAFKCEQCHKGGKNYKQMIDYKRTGLQGARNRIRSKHRKEYKQYKDIIAPNSQIHHQWIFETAEYRGVALVETDTHQYGYVDVIEILEGEITLLSEEEIKKRDRETNEKEI